MGREEGIGSSIVFQIFAFLIYVVSFFIATNERWLRQFFFDSGALILLVLLMFLSVLWSDLPIKTFTRSVAMAGTLLFSYVVCRALSLKDFTYLMVMVFGLGAIFSLVFGLFFPQLGIHAGETSIDHIGLWKGVYGFKNHLGRFMLIFFMALLVILFIYKELSIKLLFFLMVSLLLIFKSGSSTALILLVLCPVIYFCLMVIENRKIDSHLKFSLILLLSFIVILSIIILPYIVSEVFGKDMTGSGRTDVWFALFEASQNPLFGHGFGGVFWGEFNSAYFLLDEDWYNLGHAHNGLVDIWLELGYVGASVYLLLSLKILLRAYKLVIKSKCSQYTFIFLIVVFLFLYSFSGGGFVKQNNMLWVLFCCSWFYLFSYKLEVNNGVRLPFK